MDTNHVKRMRMVHGIKPKVCNVTREKVRSQSPSNVVGPDSSWPLKSGHVVRHASFTAHGAQFDGGMGALESRVAQLRFLSRVAREGVVLRPITFGP